MSANDIGIPDRFQVLSVRFHRPSGFHMTDRTSLNRSEKATLRKRLKMLRRQLPDHDLQSSRVVQQIQQLSAYQAARAVLYYIDVRDEVRIRQLVQAELETANRQVVVPFCNRGSLSLVVLKDWSELSAGTYGILEPHPLLQRDTQRHISPSDINCALIPGVGFDSTGNRLGHGQGYYDRLLCELPPDCLRVGVAYDCQIVDQIPAEPHDQRVDLLVSPLRVVNCRHPHPERTR